MLWLLSFDCWIAECQLKSNSYGLYIRWIWDTRTHSSCLHYYYLDPLATGGKKQTKPCGAGSSPLVFVLLIFFIRFTASGSVKMMPRAGPREILEKIDIWMSLWGNTIIISDEMEDAVVQCWLWMDGAERQRDGSREGVMMMHCWKRDDDGLVVVVEVNIGLFRVLRYWVEWCIEVSEVLMWVKYWSDWCTGVSDVRKWVR